MRTEYIILTALAAMVLGGALAGPKTWLHAFAVAFDAFLQNIFWDDNLGFTISARAGMVARRGNKRFANVINFLAHNSQHCEQAIEADIARAKAALAALGITCFVTT